MNDECTFVLDTNAFIILERKSLIRPITNSNNVNKILIILLNEIEEELNPSAKYHSQLLILIDEGTKKGFLKRMKVNTTILNDIKYRYTLGKGELACIAYCKENNSAIFVTNDEKAIKKSLEESIKIRNVEQFIDILDNKKVI
jgi:hypothetical protein